ncbi:MAG: UDP-N-acetylmuramate--L-alanine ligase [Tidjanibacter sp.]|nr:UDP-N-acetylmuramate--L-alanine ligase [Tidjanibacter sp.]
MKKRVYFVGIGGIGMSALARYFMHEGCLVAGYDRTRTPLTEQLEAEGAQVHYEESLEAIGEEFRDKEEVLVVYTPAIPADHCELCWFRSEGFEVVKRSEILGHLAAGKYVMAVSGTHGKTSTTTMVAWLNHCLTGGGNAFLGGISRNFNSNLVLGSGNRFAVEADEYDRSFLRLFPDVAVVTATDADHLDIYGTHENLKAAFAQFIRQINAGGSLIIKRGVEVQIDNPAISVYRYAVEAEADFYATNLTLCDDGRYRFDIVCPDRTITDCKLGIIGKVNVENCVAAVAAVWAAGEVDDELLRKALEEFGGVKRRMECYLNTPRTVYIDDYAHHPEELRATITSLREIFSEPRRKLTAIFQPHLYTRTRDFYTEFAEALSLADEVILIPIYPAREEPIEGVSSEMIAELLTVPHRIVSKERLAQEVGASQVDVVVSFGAGNIDQHCNDIASRLAERDERLRAATEE